jgi:hypothetical protein
MMLRASIETAGGKVDLRSLTDSSFADESGIKGAAALIGWVEATLASTSEGAGSSRFGEASRRGEASRFGEASRLGKASAAGEPEIAKARDRVRAELGPAAMIDAAAVIGNFERMVRIADGTGIPLDTPVNVATESIRADLGIDQFEAAARTSPVRGWQRGVGRAIDPLLKFVFRTLSRRSQV